MTYSSVLQYDDLCIRVTTADSSLLEWLDEFLTPSFSKSNDDRAHWSVSVVNSRELFESVLRNASQEAGREIDCFTRDSHFLRFPVWEEDDAQCTVYDQHCRCFYRVMRCDRTIEVICDSVKHHVRRALARLIRELATAHCLLRGDVQVHSAAYARDEGACVMVGPRRSGKTTYLTSELMDSNAQFIANDRVMLQTRGDRTIARGMPTIIKLRSKTIDLFPRLAAAQSLHSYHREYLLKERQPLPSTIAFERSMKISRAQYCELVGCRSVGARPLATLLFPIYSSAHAETESQRLSTEEASEFLYESLIPSPPEHQMAALICEPGEILLNSSLLRQKCTDIVRSVDCYRVFVGPHRSDSHFRRAA